MVTKALNRVTIMKQGGEKITFIVPSPSCLPKADKVSYIIETLKEMLPYEFEIVKISKYKE